MCCVYGIRLTPAFTALWNINFWILFLLSSFLFSLCCFCILSGSLDWSEVKLSLLLLSLSLAYLTFAAMSPSLDCFETALILISYQLWNEMVSVIVYWLQKETILTVIVTHVLWINNNTWLGCIVCIVLTLCFCLYSCQASHLLFGLPFHIGSYPSCCLFYHLMLIACLLFLVYCKYTQIIYVKHA